MRIKCPHCGERGNEEFTFLGDATIRRPDLESDFLHWMDYVYLRENPLGIFSEYAQHSLGCRAWLVVTRDTGNHRIERVENARDIAVAEFSAKAKAGTSA